VEGDDPLYLQLSVKAVCELLDLVGAQSFEFSAEKLESIARRDSERKLVAKWMVVD
jgi:hypothetical protein